MKISLIDYDKTSMPNLALMKLSAWHKANGDAVDFYEPIFSKPDKIFISKIFTFTKFEIPMASCEIELGGTGFSFSKLYEEYKNYHKTEYLSWSLKNELPKYIEHICPDYELYPNMDYSIGFITRGCVRNCDFCIVPAKEGEIRFNTHITEFQKHKKVVLLDNNILACKEGISELEAIAKTDTRIDINQGLDSRLIDGNVAKLLSRLKWIKYIRTACDSDRQFPNVKEAVELLEKAGVVRSRIQCYVLVRSEADIPRILELDKLGVKPFAMGYVDFKTSIKSQVVKDICRWVNRKEIFNVQKDFTKYIGRKKNEQA